MSEEKKPVTYRDAGVNIETGERAVDMIRKITRETYSPNVISDIGGFGGLFSLKGETGDDPVLVSGTDGVGTKLKIAFACDRHDTIGVDAVAMCVNDVICTGAKPLFFLDYLATGKIEPETVRDIVSGIANGCKLAGCSLVGGEMAEMPGFYADGEYDVAGFCVGIVDRSRIIDGATIKPGDRIIALPSSGLHSNGFSLVRKVIFDIKGHDVRDVVEELDAKTIGEALLEPTAIYAKPILALIAGVEIKGIANITGGGLKSNVERALPEGRGLKIDWTAWRRPAIFDYIAGAGVEEEEMRRVFNCGVGMVVIVAPNNADAAIKILEKTGRAGIDIGQVE